MFNPRERSRRITFLTFLFVAGLLPSGTASAAPSIGLSKKSGPPTSKILVSGRGFKSHVGVDIFFDTKDKALVVTNGKGEFHDATIHAPRSAHPGEHWVTALERNNDKGAQKPFLVQTDWNQFHFDADGIRLNPYENVLEPRTVGGLDLEWSYTTNDHVQSSPAVVNGMVYFGSWDHNVYALNARTGAKLWIYKTGGMIEDSSPAVENGVVYVGSDDFNVYALNASTGAKLWSYHTGLVVASSPAVANGVVYIGSFDDNVYALNATTGAKLWSYTTGGGVFCSPAVANGVVYIGSDDGNIYALNARTGAKLWSYQTNAFVDSSPAVTDGVVYVGTFYGLDALDARSGNKLWNSNCCGGVDSSPAVANGVVYVSAEDGNLYAFNAITGVELWSFTTGGELAWSSPAAANGVVYVGSLDDNVYALDGKTGALLWSYPTGNQVWSSPVVTNGTVYVGSWDNSVYSFRLKHGSEQAGAARKRHDLSTLRPDFNLK